MSEFHRGGLLALARFDVALRLKREAQDRLRQARDQAARELNGLELALSGAE